MGHSAAKMAPNKMKSPAKAQLGDLDKDGKMSSYETKRQNAIEKNMKGAPDKMKSPMEMKEPMKMKSPMKMGSAYKLDKSGFKLKSAPVNMRTPGSVAKMAGVSPMKNKYLTAVKEAAKGSNLTTAIQRAKISLKKSNAAEAEKKK